MSQGDIRPLRVEGAGTATTLTAMAFDRPVHLSSRSLGVWEGLLGVDVLQKAGSYPVVVTVTRADGAAVVDAGVGRTWLAVEDAAAAEVAGRRSGHRSSERPVPMAIRNGLPDSGEAVGFGGDARRVGRVGLDESRVD